MEVYIVVSGEQCEGYSIDELFHSKEDAIRYVEKEVKKYNRRYPTDIVGEMSLTSDLNWLSKSDFIQIIKRTVR